MRREIIGIDLEGSVIRYLKALFPYSPRNIKENHENLHHDNL